MKTKLGRMEAFDALLEARFEDFFSGREESGEQLGDEAERETPESVDGGGKDPLPPMPPPAPDPGGPSRQAARLA